MFLRSRPHQPIENLLKSAKKMLVLTSSRLFNKCCFHHNHNPKVLLRLIDFWDRFQNMGSFWLWRFWKLRHLKGFQITYCAPVYQSSNLVRTLRLIDSIGLRVERPYSPSSRRIPWYFSRSLAHTHADIDLTMPNMCTGAFYVLHRLNNSCAIYAIYTVVSFILFLPITFLVNPVSLLFIIFYLINSYNTAVLNMFSLLFCANKFSTKNI